MLGLVNNIMDEFKRKSILHNYDPWDEIQGKDRHKQWGRRAARRSSNQSLKYSWLDEYQQMIYPDGDDYLDDIWNDYWKIFDYDYWDDRDYYESYLQWFRDMKEQGYDFGYSLE